MHFKFQDLWLVNESYASMIGPFLEQRGFIGSGTAAYAGHWLQMLSTNQRTPKVILSWTKYKIPNGLEGASTS